MPIIILSLVMFGVILLANHFITNLYIQIIIGGIIGVTVYLGGAILFKFKELNDVKYMLKRKA